MTGKKKRVNLIFDCADLVKMIGKWRYHLSEIKTTQRQADSLLDNKTFKFLLWTFFFCFYHHVCNTRKTSEHDWKKTKVKKPK